MAKKKSAKKAFLGTGEKTKRSSYLSSMGSQKGSKKSNRGQ